MKKQTKSLIQKLIPYIIPVVLICGGIITNYIFYSKIDGKILETRVEDMRNTLNKFENMLRNIN